jgi:hypothetical protein
MGNGFAAWLILMATAVSAPQRPTAAKLDMAPPAPAPTAPSPARVVSRAATPRTEITGLRLAESSGREMRVTVRYVYVGEQGQDDVFLHAAALLGDGLRSRVPGTTFPGEPVNVGTGSVTLAITKVLDTGAFTSRAVRACLVSLRARQAFVCRNFPLRYAWE